MTRLFWINFRAEQVSFVFPPMITLEIGTYSWIIKTLWYSTALHLQVMLFSAPPPLAVSRSLPLHPTPPPSAVDPSYCSYSPCAPGVPCAPKFLERAGLPAPDAGWWPDNHLSPSQTLPEDLWSPTWQLLAVHHINRWLDILDWFYSFISLVKLEI